MKKGEIPTPAGITHTTITISNTIPHFCAYLPLVSIYYMINLEIVFHLITERKF